MEARGNVSVSSSDSVASSGSSNSSDDESVSAMNTPNKKSKISSVPEVSDDSSDDDDAIPAVVVSSDGPNRAFQHAQTGATSGGIAAYNHTSSHYQKKYEPPTSNTMSKVELSLWRKQQRQQRNRMSAAASRQKQKARITELEQQIAEYQRKYAAIQNEINRAQQKLVVPQISSSIGSTVEVLDNSSPINEVTSSTGTKTNDIVNPTAHFVPTSPVSVSLSSPVPEVVTLSSSNTPFKMISRQALSQELSFTPSLFFRTL
jgi:Skp family chaperone for outer membrane proteins